MQVTLLPLQKKDEEWFVKNNQIAFQKSFTETFGESDNWVLPKSEIRQLLDNENSIAYGIQNNGIWVGGIVLTIHKITHRNLLDLFFINPDIHSQGIGTRVWELVEKMYPETKIWETYTPYFEKRNIHFYVNKCGFKIVEFFNSHHQSPHISTTNKNGLDHFFLFEKVMFNQ